MSHRIFSGPLFLFAYVLGAVAILAGYFQSYAPVIAALAFFLAWDIAFVFTQGAFSGRTVAGINEGITRARTYVSWFIALYGALIGLAYTAGDPAGSTLLAASTAANVPLWLLASPLAFAFISMLFISISLDLGESESPAPSPALRSVFCLVIFLEKVILILFGHPGLRILSVWTP